MSTNNDGKVFKSGIWYTFSNFLSKGLVFLTTPIFARILTKAEYGQYSNFTTWQTLLLVIVTLELYSTISRARYDFEKEIDQYISSIALLGTLFTIFCYGIVITFMSKFKVIFSMEEKYIHILFLYLLTAPALQILQVKYRIFMEYKLATLVTIASSFGSVIVSLIMVFLCNDKLFGRIFGQTIVLILVNTCIFIWILVKGKCFNYIYCRYSLIIALPLVPHLLAGNLLGTFDKIAIQKICGSDELAYYSIAFNCALLAKVLWDSLNQAMVPWLYDNLTVNNIVKIKSVSKKYVAIFLMVAVGIMLIAPEIIFIFGGKAYSQARYIMPPIIMGSCFQFVYSMYVNVEMYEKKTLFISIGTMFSAILNILLNYFFIIKFGYIAAAYTTMFCYGVLMTFHYFIVRKIKMSHVYSNKFNFALLGIMCYITILMEFIYYRNITRWLALFFYVLILLFVCLKNKKALVKSINMFVKNKI